MKKIGQLKKKCLKKCERSTKHVDPSLDCDFQKMLNFDTFHKEKICQKITERPTIHFPKIVIFNIILGR